MTAIKRLGEVDRQVSSEFEGEIREFIRRDVSTRRPGATGEPLATSQAESDNLNSLLERVSGATVAEIDRLIAELQTIRSLLQSEGDRVRREITGYAGLSQSAVATMKVINDTLTQLRPSTQSSPTRKD
jgi:ABC-type transporter Mla subunit MlaD